MRVLKPHSTEKHGSWKGPHFNLPGCWLLNPPVSMFVGRSSCLALEYACFLTFRCFCDLCPVPSGNELLMVTKPPASWGSHGELRHLWNVSVLVFCYSFLSPSLLLRAPSCCLYWVPFFVPLMHLLFKVLFQQQFLRGTKQGGCFYSDMCWDTEVEVNRCQAVC